ncbi:hypothetical protein N7E70_007025 [Aminobacter sp. NyZ550]|jgi:hypothetical protein|uniref:hypothetical protein n=1 Tax=unclassified Aminobacter TaxID=2644704 RepID=UPI0021D57699|nr:MULTISPECIES: hypothetical protein [unclassified Aminobacter]WAX96610.1 hypothetical protein N7E70_007025 [Aminobacter sp. NyZ550]BBD39924.1 hypothetical protein Amn_48040 [Aminobacter sp. SS-2016]
MYELLQNLLAATWYGQPAEGVGDALPDEAATGGVSERLHSDLDTCFQAIHEQISERER